MKRLLVLLAVACVPPAPRAAEPTMASADGMYQVSPKRLTSGGGTAQGGPYRLDASIGQAEASRRIGGGSFSATLGLHAPARDPSRIFQDGFDAFGDGFEKMRKK